jgi:hypothetical protein
MLGTSILTMTVSSASFTATTPNPGNRWSGGTILLAGDNSGSAIFTTGAVGANQKSGAKLLPGESMVNCVKVSYSGNVSSAVTLYTSAVSETAPGGTGLLDYLHVKVEEGTAGAFGCAGFGGTVTTRWDSATHPGAASDHLRDFPTAGGTLNSGLSSWSNGTFRVYRITMTVDANTPATSEAATATATFNWTATA